MFGNNTNNMNNIPTNTNGAMNNMTGTTKGGRRRNRKNRSMRKVEMTHHYETTAKGVMMWAAGELEHVGRIASIKDADIQYNYAMSTLFGMAHLKDALFELVKDPDYEHQKKDLQKTHDNVVRVMKHLCKDYDLDLKAVKKFNTKNVLSNLKYLTSNNNNYNNINNNNNNNSSSKSRTRKNRK